MAKFTKEIMVAEAVNEVAFYKKLRNDKSGALKSFSARALWAIQKNYKELEQIANNFEELKTSLNDDIRKTFFEDNTKSHEIVEEVDDGNGGKKKQTMRQVNDDYMNDYRSAVEDANNKLNELLTSKETVTFDAIDMDKEVENMPEDSGLDLDTLDMLSMFVKDGDAN